MVLFWQVRFLNMGFTNVFQNSKEPEIKGIICGTDLYMEVLIDNFPKEAIFSFEAEDQIYKEFNNIERFDKSKPITKWEKQNTNQVISEQQVTFEGNSSEISEVYAIKLNGEVISYTTQSQTTSGLDTVVSEFTQVINSNPLFNATKNGSTIEIETVSGANLELEIVTKNTNLAMINTSTTIAGWTQLDGTNGNPNYTGYLNLTALEEGSYRYTISAIDVNQCTNNSDNQSTQGVIIVENESKIVVREGPIVDEYLCNGKAGSIYLDIFDGNTGPLSFTYNDLPATYDQVGNGQYIVYVDSPVESADLGIINAINCSISIPINIGNGTPLLDFTSSNYQSSGVYLAREDITFSDISEITCKDKSLSDSVLFNSSIIFDPVSVRAVAIMDNEPPPSISVSYTHLTLPTSDLV